SISSILSAGFRRAEERVAYHQPRNAFSGASAPPQFMSSQRLCSTRRSIASVIPPCTIGECSQVDLVRPRGAVLFREVDVGLRDLRGQHKSVMFVASGVSQLFEPFWSQHLSQG